MPVSPPVTMITLPVKSGKPDRGLNDLEKTPITWRRLDKLGRGTRPGDSKTNCYRLLMENSVLGVQVRAEII